MTPEENGGHHYVEETASVYLEFDFDENRWVVSSATVDGCALDSPIPGGVRNSECECEDRQACTAATARADKVPLPNAEELVALLQEAMKD